jgi:hypothetical protein
MGDSTTEGARVLLLNDLISSNVSKAEIALPLIHLVLLECIAGRTLTHILVPFKKQQLQSGRYGDKCREL